MYLNIETNIPVSLINIFHVKKHHRKNILYRKYKLDIHVYFTSQVEKTEK
jgi:hypothetical protein